MLPSDYLRALRTLLDEIQEEAEFEARYGMPPKGLSIDRQYGGATAGEHWPKRPTSDSTLGSDRPGDNDVEAARQQSSGVAK